MADDKANTLARFQATGMEERLVSQSDALLRKSVLFATDTLP